MEFPALGQIHDILSGTSQHLCGLCCVDYPAHHEVAEIGSGERHLFADSIEHVKGYNTIEIPGE